MKRKYVFGPILSRRLGISLGVDLVTPKTCPLDCIYCEARATTDLTVTRKEYVPVDEVIAELDHTLKNAPLPDYITFSGAGEPTLNSRIGDVVRFVKSHYPQCKLCLLTNGVLFGDAALRADVAAADLVIPSLDASNEAEYQQINRPHRSSTLATLVADITAFAREYKHRLVLEIFIVPGINDSPASITRFAQLVAQIAPQAVQLNTLDRPGVVADIQVATPEKLAEFSTALQPYCQVEIIKPLTKEQQRHTSSSLEEKLLDILAHRCLDLTALAQVSGIPEAELRPELDRLLRRQLIVASAAGYTAFQRSE